MSKCWNTKCGTEFSGLWGWGLQGDHCGFPREFTYSAQSNASPKCVRAVSHYSDYGARWFSRIRRKSLSTHRGIKHGNNYCTLSLAVGLVLLGGVHTILLISPLSSNWFGFHYTGRVCKWAPVVNREERKSQNGRENFFRLWWIFSFQLVFLKLLYCVIRGWVC